MVGIQYYVDEIKAVEKIIKIRIGSYFENYPIQLDGFNIKDLRRYRDSLKKKLSDHIKSKLESLDYLI